MEGQPINLRGGNRIRQAALHILCGSAPQSLATLQSLSPRQWRSLLRWLDYSGLALYFFDQVCESEQLATLPAAVAEDLERRLEENTLRTANMTAESIDIQIRLQKSGMRYALLKGLSLWPNSVPRPELRSQFDLDFLLSPADLAGAREILEGMGYRLYSKYRRSWEFKRNEKPGFDRRHLYRDTGSFRTELHAEAGGEQNSLLDRVERRELRGFSTPVLAPVDLFLGQGLHAFKHLLSEFVRAAYLVEFRRHVLFRSGDRAFWQALEQRAAENPTAAATLGATTLLTTLLTGEFAPEAFTHWTICRIPPAVRLWLQLYARRGVLAPYPGNKLYLLLERALDNSESRPVFTLRQQFLPLHLPAGVIRAFPNEALSMRMRRFWMNFKRGLERIHFHIAEAPRFAWELRRWTRLVNRVAP